MTHRLINRCNLVIEGVTNAITKGIVTQAVGDNYIGQAKFLRAITHFELLAHLQDLTTLQLSNSCTLIP
jgi:hypothetical protein